MAAERPTFYQREIEHQVTSGLGYREHLPTITGSQKDDEARLGGRNTSAAVQLRLGLMSEATKEPGTSSNQFHSRILILSGIHSDRKNMGPVSSAIHRIFRPTQTPEQILKEVERRQRAHDRRMFDQEWEDLRAGTP